MTSEPTIRLGVLGGTFDPVHLGHLMSATEVAEAFALDKVLLMLSARPPHKSEARPASVEARLAMLDSATHDRPLLEPSDLEVHRPGPSYTVDTLGELARAHPDAELFLILGIDAYLDLDSWHRPAEVVALANVIVTTRPGYALGPEAWPPRVAALGDACYKAGIAGYAHSSGHTVVGHTLSGIEASASEIRAAAGAGLSFDRWLTAPVASYIREHGLYGAPSR